MADTDKTPATQPEPELVPSPDRLPGQRDGLPPGALGGIPTDPQGDENRDPPANAPTIPE
jgi:hypothetical protein